MKAGGARQQAGRRFFRLKGMRFCAEKHALPAFGGRQGILS